MPLAPIIKQVAAFVLLAVAEKAIREGWRYYFRTVDFNPNRNPASTTKRNSQIQFGGGPDYRKNNTD